MIIIGIVCAVFCIMCVATSIIEHLDDIGEWLFDLGTAYYKFKQRRSKKWH